MYYEQPISEPPQDQSYQNWSQMTPQQKMAFQMMLNKPQKTDPRGAYSTSQGISDMLGSALQLYLMGRGKFGAPPAQQGQGMPWAGPDSGGMMNTMG